MGKEFKLGLVAGRHNLPVDEYIFEEGDITFPINPEALQHVVAKKLDELECKPSSGNKLVVYVTGLTPATTAVIVVAFTNHHFLTLMHYNRDNDDWIEDPIFTECDDMSYDAGFPAWG